MLSVPSPLLPAWEKLQASEENLERLQLGVRDCLLLLHPDWLQLEIPIPREHGGKPIRNLSSQEFWKYTLLPPFLTSSRKLDCFKDGLSPFSVHPRCFFPPQTICVSCCPVPSSTAVPLLSFPSPAGRIFPVILP